MKRLPRPVWLMAGAVVLGLIVAGALLLKQCGSVSGCDRQGLPRGPVTVEQVKGHAEAHLFYPGAHLYWPISGAQQDNTIEGGTDFAFAGGILISTDSPTAIYKWYEDWLNAHGWVQYENVGSTTWLSHLDFKRGAREYFTVAVADPSALSRVLGTPVPQDRGTLFEVRYQIAPAASS